MQSEQHVLYQMPKQREFCTARDRYLAYVGGFGSGKTISLVDFVTYRTFELVGERGMLGAPTGPQLEASTLATMFERWDELGIEENVHYKYERGIGRITCFKTGSNFWIRSFQNSFRVQGPSLTWFGIDEIEGVPDKVWRVLKTRLRGRRLRDPRSFRCGRMAGNPPTGAHWFLRDFYRPDTKRPKHRLITASSLENFLLDDETREDYATNIYTPGSPMYRRYIGGELDVGAEGLIYDEFHPDVHGCTEEEVPWDDMEQWLYGIDFGFVNAFVFLVIGRDKRGCYWIVGEYYMPGKLLSEHVRAMKNLRRVRGPAYADHAAQEREELAALGFPTIPAWKDDAFLGIQGIKQLLNPLQRGGPKLRVVKKNCPNTCREFNSYHWKEQKSDKAAEEEPDKVDDHCMDAMRYAIATELKLRGQIVFSHATATSQGRKNVGSIGFVAPGGLRNKTLTLKTRAPGAKERELRKRLLHTKSRAKRVRL